MHDTLIASAREPSPLMPVGEFQVDKREDIFQDTYLKRRLVALLMGLVLTLGRVWRVVELAQDLGDDFDEGLLNFRGVEAVLARLAVLWGHGAVRAPVLDDG